MKGWLAAPLLAACTAMQAQAAEPPPGPVRLFDHWTVACDNLASCVAVNVADPRLSISRDGGWDSLPDVTVAIAEGQAAPTHLRLVRLAPVTVRGRHRRSRFRLDAAGEGMVRLPRRVRGRWLRLAWRPVAGMIRRPSADSADRDRLRPRR